jgi:membrane fusion protein (multidrug efflux system)
MNAHDVNNAGSASRQGKVHSQRKILTALLCGVLLLAFLTIGAYSSNTMQYREVTEDAYVEGNVVQVTTQVAGTVISIAADNTDHVSAGQALVKLNPVDAQLALERSEAQLAKTVRQVRSQYAVALQMHGNVDMRRVELNKVEADLERRSQLVKSGAISGEDLEHAREAVRAARAALSSTEQQYAANQAYIDRTSIASHPDVLSAAAQVKDAYIATMRTLVPAPVSGLVAKRNVQVGQRVAAGTALMSVVPIDDVWVTANFKESQLRHLRLGQPVTLVADAYGGEVSYHGKVVGQEAGTGSAFSLMPAQNATGNWIKVVQRIPVRIALDPVEVTSHPLQIGLSMKVSVDTSERGGARLANNSTHSYHTDVFRQEDKEAASLVSHIIDANLASAQASPQRRGG